MNDIPLDLKSQQGSGYIACRDALKRLWQAAVWHVISVRRNLLLTQEQILLGQSGCLYEAGTYLLQLIKEVDVGNRSRVAELSKCECAYHCHCQETNCTPTAARQQWLRSPARRKA